MDPKTPQQFQPQDAFETWDIPQGQENLQTQVMPQGQADQQARVMPQGQDDLQTRVMPQPQAGQQTQVMPQGQNAYQTQAMPQGQEGYADQPVAHQNQLDPIGTHKKRNRGLRVVAVLAVIAILAAAGVLIYQKVMADKAYQEEHAMHKVALDLAAPGYNPETDSKIKVHIAGNDLDGKPVAQDVFISSRTDTFELMKGEYQISFEASPLMASGKFYELPAPVDFTIDDKNLSPAPVVTFTEANLAEVTDQQIDAAYEIALAGGMSESDATGLRNAVMSARTDAKEKAARDAEEQAKRAEAKQRQSSFHIDTADFEFDIPEYLWDKVDWDHVNANGMDVMVTVFRAGHPDQELFSVWSTTNSSYVENQGDIGAHVVGYKKGKKYVGVSSTNYAFFATDKTLAGRYTEADLKELVDLCTGGAMTYDKAIELGPEKVGVPDIDFYESTVISGLVAK